MTVCARYVALGAGVAVYCTRYEDHPPPCEAPVVLFGPGGSSEPLVGRVQWPHVIADRPPPLPAAAGGVDVAGGRGS